MRLRDKVAMITGAASGIGEASARLFAREGARVVLVDVDEARGVQVSRETGEPATFMAADVTRSSDMERVAGEVVRLWGRIDVLFNNAGISCVGTVHETPEADWDRVMAVNVKGVYLAARAVVPHMMQQRSGCIINMSSCIADIGLVQRAAYAASKGAVLSLTRSMQADYAAYGIRVNALLPGTIYTPFVAGYLHKHFGDNIPQAMENLKRRQLSGTLGEPEDVAYAALYLASDEAKFVYGSGLVVDGGVSSAKV